MTHEELTEVLRLHKLWLNDDTGGKLADLSRASLSEANLSSANLSRADLSRADLSRANLYWADLSRASLSEANLSGANLFGANLYGAKNIPAAAAARLMRCPPEGEFIAWKKCARGVLVKLRIPKDANRSSASGYKCRASHAVVLDIVSDDVVIARSMHSYDFTYKVGETVHCDKWCEDRWQECGGGIHFYMSREEAEAHC